MDHNGNLYIKKLTDADVLVREYSEGSVSDSCLSEDVQKAQGQLEAGKPAKVTLMRPFSHRAKAILTFITPSYYTQCSYYEVFYELKSG